MGKAYVLAFAVASLVSTASFAGAQAPAPGAAAERHAMGRGMDGARGHRDGGLRGLTLSEAEKAKVKEVRARQKAEATSWRESMKPMREEARALRQKGDTAGLRALREKNKGSSEKMQALHTRYQGELRAALSPENQAKFDVNTQERAKRRAEWQKSGKQGRHGAKKGGRRPGSARPNQG